jgi:hypothetical protein
MLLEFGRLLYIHLHLYTSAQMQRETRWVESLCNQHQRNKNAREGTAGGGRFVPATWEIQH